jgi:hypothetical protein
MNDKVPLVIIIAVVIFILIFVVVIASYTDSSNDTKTLPYNYKPVKSNPLASNIQIQNLSPYRESDSLITEFSSLNDNESIIFGGSLNYSNVSIYKNDNLIYTKLFSGNNGFVVSNNQQNINASFFQIGKKIELENIKYSYIPIDTIDPEKDKFRIVVSSVSSENFKIFKCSFNYNILIDKTQKNYIKTLNQPFGISEYDIEKYILKNSENSNMEKYLINRSFDKKNKRVWEFCGEGTFLVYYVKGLYSYTITDNKNNINILEQNTVDKSSIRTLNSYIENGNVSIESFYITNPCLQITNLDENIPEKNINSDLISLLNTPMEFYKHFLYGKKNISIDIWNRMHNKILIFKV